MALHTLNFFDIFIQTSQLEWGKNEKRRIIRQQGPMHLQHAQLLIQHRPNSL